MEIVEIDNLNMAKLFNTNRFDLPMTWDGNDFYKTLNTLFDDYKYQITITGVGTSQLSMVQEVCDSILEIIEFYFNGLHSKSYTKFCSLMDIIEPHLIKEYTKTYYDEFVIGNRNYDVDPLSLYRINYYNNLSSITRNQLFHIPFNLRHKVSNSRYSCIGYPCLYLSTSLKLCEQETNFTRRKINAYASKFKIIRNERNSDIRIKVLEFGIKPQDFKNRNIDANNMSDNILSINSIILNSKSAKENFIICYPLIATCSFIKKHKKDPFSPEYIIPQFLMQWVIEQHDTTPNILYGIRYFSCASKVASKKDFNYVFPTDTTNPTTNHYCSKLSNSFVLTSPTLIRKKPASDYALDISTLDSKTDYDHVN